MLSRSGKLMAAPDPDDLLRPLLQILPEGQDVALWGGLLTDVAGGGSVTADTPCGEVQGRCIIKLAPLQSTRWPVGVYYSEWEMLAPLRSYLVKTAASAALTLALLIAGIIWVSRRITRPLTSLAAATTDIASGNFHNTLPVIRSRDELGRLVDAFSLMQDNLQQYVTRLETETASRNRLLGELSAATAIQMSMLPGRGRAFVDDPRFRLWAALRPAKSVGGDLYTFHLPASDRLFIGVGDVSDKGVPAALFMARAMTLLQQHAHTGQAPDRIMRHLNDELVDGNDNCMFVTLFLGWLDLDSLVLTFTSGGHTPPSLLRDGQCSSLGQDQGPALGLSENLEFPVNRLQLQPGDTLAVFTDGVDEAFNSEGEQLGLDAFNRVLAAPSQHLEALGQSCFDAIDLHAGDTAQSDDITILLLQLKTSAQPGPVLQLPADGHAIRSLMGWLDEQLQGASLTEQALAEIRLVAEEVVTNILKYAGLKEEARIEVRLDRDAESLALEFSDAGIPFDPLVEARRSELGSDIESAAIGGLGVHLFEALTDEQTYRRVDGKNQLRLLKRLQ
jgi:sigma-B regulation protein RsbU (phosphoserine phosphatase)